MARRTLDGYLLRATAAPFAAGLGLFVVVTAFAEVLTFTDTTTGLGIGIADMAALVLYSLPPLLGVLLPISGLYATLLAVGGMAQRRELLALSQMGQSLKGLVRVPLIFGGVLALASMWALMMGEPWGIRCVRAKMAEGTTRALIEGVKPGLFYEWVEGLTFWARHQDGQDLRAVMLADHRVQDRPWMVSAARGRLTLGDSPQELWVVLEDGRALQKGQEPGVSHVLEFAQGVWRIDVGALVQKKLHRVSQAQELSMAQLAQESRAPHLSLDARVLRQFMWHRKIAVPVAAIIFTLLAVPLGARAAGGHRASGILIATAAVAAYYHVGRFLELSARSGTMPGFVAAWLPNVIGALVCALLFANMDRQNL